REVPVRFRVLTLFLVLFAVACALSASNPRPEDNPTMSAMSVCSNGVPTPPRAEACATLAGPGFSAVPFADLGRDGKLAADTATQLAKVAADRDAFESQRIAQLCTQRVESPCDPVLALALSSALADRQQAVAAAMSAASDAHAEATEGRTALDEIVADW